MEAPVDGFIWYLPELERCVGFDILDGFETCPFEGHFRNRGQPIV
jgi:hypothetical protein